MKLRSDFVTNSSSANYCVTLRVDGSGGEHAEFRVHTYDCDPWYEDTEQGCENYDRQARVLTYHVEDAVEGAKDREDVRELSDTLLSAIREYGWGVNHDWWQDRENRSYFYSRWYRDRLLEARKKGADESAVSPSQFDFDAYVDELRSQGKRLEGLQPTYPPNIMADAMRSFGLRWYRDLLENICQGWSFAIVGWPRIYRNFAALESYIVEHGGTVDDRVKATTDFVINCSDGVWLGDGLEEYWTFDVSGDRKNLESYRTDPDTPVSYEWKYYESEKTGFSGLEEYCGSFQLAKDSFDHLFEEAMGDIVSEGVLDVSYFVIPEHEFVRRFDPQREKGKGMPFDVAHPIIAHRFAQVLESRGITPEHLESVSYERHISAFGDSFCLLGFSESDRGTDVTYEGNDYVDWSSWGDSEDIDEWYRRA